MRSKLGGPSLGDDELLMRYVAGNEDVEAMRTGGAIGWLAWNTLDVDLVLPDILHRRLPRL